MKQSCLCSLSENMRGHGIDLFFVGKLFQQLQSCATIILKRFSTIDIDNLDDWKEAELFFRLRKLKKI